MSKTFFEVIHDLIDATHGSAGEPARLEAHQAVADHQSGADQAAVPEPAARTVGDDDGAV